MRNECCEELGKCLNLNTSNVEFNFQETIYHAEDLRYAGVKDRDLERHVLKHEWKEKNSIFHHGLPIFLYVIIGLLPVYVLYRLIIFMMSEGTCQRVAGAQRAPRVAADCLRARTVLSV